MKLFNLIITAIVLVAATTANAETFNYSFTAAGGAEVNGSFDGSSNGTLVTDLSHVSAFVDGIAFNGNGSLFVSSMSSAGSWQNDGAVMSFDGTKNNFFFSNGDPADARFSNMIFSLTGAPAGNFGTSIVAQGGFYTADGGSPPAWTLTAAVPEPETYAMLLAGLGLIGAASRRRKLKHLAA